MLIAILGGVALAGGLYFGNGGLPNFGQDRSQSQSQEPASAPSLEPPSAPETGGTSLSQLTTPSRPAPIQQAQPPRREPQPPPQRATTAQPATRDVNAAASPFSAPRTANNTTSGGPISLFGPQSNTQVTSNPARIGAQNTATPMGPQQDAPPTVVAMNSPPPVVAAPAPQGAVRWTSRPTARRIADLYPDAASRQGVGGRVELNCTVTPSLGLACGVASETPPGLGFGHAALSVANSYRVAPVLSDGSGAVGTRTRIAVQFQAPAQ
ncbi:MAG: energy transducer TonB [Proteobacteria bacterium]|nr:energy transducer TonB [Pseudomonadota bacterium]